MATVEGGPVTWSVDQDRDGYREYSIVHRVRCNPAIGEGPAAALQASGLPAPGSTWDFTPQSGASGDDVDVDVYCKLDAKVTIDQERKGDIPKYYLVEQKFTNKGDPKRCKTDSIDDPLLEPQKVSGSFIKFTEEATLDRFSDPILTSSFEFIRGPQNEWDANRPQVMIEQNVASLQLDVCSQMVDTLNNHTIWGVPPRCVKLSDVSWERKFHGSCYVYYTRKFTFDIRYRRIAGVSSLGVTGTGTSSHVGLDVILTGDYETFDREIIDEGTKALHGHWSNTTGNWVLDNIGGAPPNSDNPHHYSRFKDRNGENARVILKDGLPADTTIGTGTGTFSNIGFGKIRVEKYGESDFLILGLPADL